MARAGRIALILKKYNGLSYEEIARIMDRFVGAIDSLPTRPRQKRELLLNLLTREEVDAGAVEGLRKDMAGIQDQIQREVIAHILDMKKILDSEQETHFFQLLQMY